MKITWVIGATLLSLAMAVPSDDIMNNEPDLCSTDRSMFKREEQWCGQRCRNNRQCRRGRGHRCPRCRYGRCVPRWGREEEEAEEE